MYNGMFLVDLRDGSTTVRRLERRGGHADFRWSPDSDELVMVVSGRSSWVSVPVLRLRAFPRPDAYPRVLADAGGPRGAYGNHRHDWEILRTDLDFRADARLILPAGSKINGVQWAFDSSTLELAAINSRLLLAWLVDEGEIVRLIRPGIGDDPGGMDWWDVSFARNLVRIHWRSAPVLGLTDLP